MNGNDLSLLGLESGTENLGLELGIQQCSGAEPLPELPPVLRVIEASPTASIFTAARATVGRDGPAFLEIVSDPGPVRFDVPGDFIVGGLGTGSISIDQDSSNASITYGGPEDESFIVGNMSDGEIILMNGCLTANEDVTSTILGYHSESMGQIIIDGSQGGVSCGAHWFHEGVDLTIGFDGLGVIEARAGAILTTDLSNIITLAQNPGSQAFVTINGASSRWDAPFTQIRGGLGTALISLEDGGTISTGFGLQVSSDTHLEGEGTVRAIFAGGLINLGTVSPSTSLGSTIQVASLYVDGDFRQLDDSADPQQSGRLEIDLALIDGNPTSDTLVVTDQAELSGRFYHWLLLEMRKGTHRLWVSCRREPWF